MPDQELKFVHRSEPVGQRFRELADELEKPGAFERLKRLKMTDHDRDETMQADDYALDLIGRVSFLLHTLRS